MFSFNNLVVIPAPTCVGSQLPPASAGVNSFPLKREAGAAIRKTYANKLYIAGICLTQRRYTAGRISLPNIPGLLSFRDAPVCIAAVEKLKSKPELFIMYGQGIAHPIRLGLAAHLGLFFDKLTVGCAKSRLTGQFEEPPLETHLAA